MYRIGNDARDAAAISPRPTSFPADGPPMRLLRYTRENPVALLSVAVAALVVWAAVDLGTAPPRKKPTRLAESDYLEIPLPKAAVAAAVADDLTAPAATQAITPGQTVVSAAALPKLRPGMTRAEVESLIGAPASDAVHPVTVEGGRATYRTAYELDDLGPPMTIRPIHSRSRIPPPPREPGSVVIALEFDATRAGHPLVDIVYPDPLF
jgi:hypothetical protein